MLHKVFMALCFCCFCSAKVFAANAMLIWVSEPDAGVTQVNIQVMQDDVWRPVEKIYSSKESNFSPSLGSNSKGVSLVVWSATSTIRSILRAKFFINGAWQSTEILSNQGAETTTPAVIFDRHDNATVVWVSNHAGPDDIYMREWNAKNKQWSDIEKVNTDNNGPDILPTLSLDQHGDVVVRWSSLDQNSLTYIEQVKVYEKSNSVDHKINPEIRELTASDIKMPEDLPVFSGKAVMHFPDNLQNRQVKFSR